MDVLALHVDGHVTSTRRVRATVDQVKTLCLCSCAHKKRGKKTFFSSLLFRLMEKLDLIAADSSP